MLLSDESGIHYINSKNPICSTKSELFDPRVITFYSDETIDDNVKNNVSVQMCEDLRDIISIKIPEKYNLYIDVSEAQPYHTLYFRLFNNRDIKKASKCARIKISKSTYIHCDDDFKGEWNLNNEEKQILMEILTQNNYMVWKKIVRVQTDFLSVKRKEDKHLLRMRDKYTFKIPNYLNLPDGPKIKSADIDTNARFDLSKNLNEEFKNILFIEAFSDLYIDMHLDLTNPYIRIFNADRIYNATKCARIRIYEPSYVHCEDSNKEFWKLNNEEKKLLKLILTTPLYNNYYRDRWSEIEENVWWALDPRNRCDISDFTLSIPDYTQLPE